MFNVGLFVASLPNLGTPQSDFLNDPTVRSNLHDAGLSVGAYALLQAIPLLFGALVSLAVGLIIFWSKPTDPMALFVALLLILFFASPDPEWVRGLPPMLSILAEKLRFIAVASIGSFFFLFPDGRFVPHWTRWLAIYWVASQALLEFGPPPTPGVPPAPWFRVLYPLH